MAIAAGGSLLVTTLVLCGSWPLPKLGFWGRLCIVEQYPAPFPFVFLCLTQLAVVLKLVLLSSRSFM